MLPTGYLTVHHGIDGPNRNRCFTVIKHGGFSMAMAQITRWFFRMIASRPLFFRGAKIPSIG